MANRTMMDDGIAEVLDIKLGARTEADFAQMRKGKAVIKVNEGQDPYSVIGKYIREHMTAIEDMIAVIEIDGYITNELFMVDMDVDGYFVWKSDWWEGEKNVSLVDFFPVSDAKKPSAQLDKDIDVPNSTDCISRQAAINALDDGAELLRRVLDNADIVGVEREKYEWGLGLIESYISDMKELPLVQPEPEEFEWCTDCKEYDQEAHCCHRWTKVIRNTVEEIKNAQSEPGWIPVTEKPPEAGVRYQVTFESGEVGYADFRNKIFLWDGSVKENVWKIEQYYEDDGEVIAWRPLSKPYKRSE